MGGSHPRSCRRSSSRTCTRRGSGRPRKSKSSMSTQERHAWHLWLLTMPVSRPAAQLRCRGLPRLAKRVLQSQEKHPKTAHSKGRENNVEMDIAAKSDSFERAQYFSGLHTLDGMDAFRSARVLGEYK